VSVALIEQESKVRAIGCAQVNMRLLRGKAKLRPKNEEWACPLVDIRVRERSATKYRKQKGVYHRDHRGTQKNTEKN